MGSRLRSSQVFNSFCIAVALTGSALWLCAAGMAQVSPPATFQGVVTQSEADGFSVNGNQLIIGPKTRFYPVHTDGVRSVDSLRVLLQPGACVRVHGTMNPGGPLQVASVSFCGKKGLKSSGVGIVQKILSTAPDLEFEADGLRILPAQGARLSFLGSIQRINDLVPGVVVRFRGAFDPAGEFQAVRLQFFSPKKVHAPADSAMRASSPAESVQEVSSVGPAPNIVNDDGALGTMRGKLNPPQGWHALSRDSALQERVRRLGARLIPAYQTQLAAGDPSKIPFRFFVVNEKWIRSFVPAKLGAVLISSAAVERTQNDDQLAAIIADAIAFQMQTQRANLVPANFVDQAGEVAGVLTELALDTSGLAAGGIAKGIINHEQERVLAEDRGRIALSLMADAGFDPWQAPEAWRRVAAGKLPKDPAKLKYPPIAKYDLEILNLTYPAVSGLRATAVQPPSEAAGASPQD